jgi:hypothetical protein
MAEEKTGYSANPDYESVTTENVNRELNPAEFAGDDLAAKVSNALAALEGDQGRIRITPKPGGGSWGWSQTVTIDVLSYEGIQIDIDSNVGINDTTTGYALVVEEGSGSGTAATGDLFELNGGKWFNQTAASGGDPSGWMKLKDIKGADIRPASVYGYQNGDGDSTAIRLENVDSFCEGNTIVPRVVRCDIGLDFVPASVTGGTGTDSFDGHYLRPTVSGTKNIGIRFRGLVQQCHIDSAKLFLDAQNTAAMVWDADFLGTVFTAPKMEGSSKTDEDGIEIGSNYDNPPVIHGGEIVNLDDTVDSTTTGVSGETQVPRIEAGFKSVPFKFSDLESGVSSEDRLSRATHTTTTSIPDDTITTVPLDSTAAEDAAVASVDTANDVITIQAAGEYRVTSAVRWDGSSSWSAGDQLLLITSINGGNNHLDYRPHPGVNEFYSVQQSRTFQLSAGDEVSMTVRQQSGGSESINGINTTSFLEVARIGP